MYEVNILPPRLKSRISQENNFENDQNITCGIFNILRYYVVENLPNKSH